MSATDKRERRSHFRGKARPGRRVEIEYRVEGAEPRRAFTRDIGVGGAFIVSETPERPGTPIELLVRIPTSTDPVKIHGEVRWSTPDGMGVRFAGLDVEELLQLNEYFASLTGHEEAEHG